VPLGERVDTRLNGRGTTDTKGGVAAMFRVGLAYDRTDTEPPVDCQFVLVSGEEIGRTPDSLGRS
jgi:succinyl-diaminopimelate desuccinylase